MQEINKAIEKKAKRILAQERSREERLLNFQIEQDARKSSERRMKIFKLGMVFAGFFLCSIQFEVSLVALGAFISLVVLVVLAFMGMLWVDLMILSLVTLAACAALMVGTLMVIHLIDQWISKMPIFNWQPTFPKPGRELQMTKEEAMSFDFQVAVVKNAFHYVDEQQDSVSQFLADFVIKACQKSPDRINPLVSLMLQKEPEQEDLQKWIKHHSIFLQHICTAQEIQPPLRQALVMGYLSAFFNKNITFYPNDKKMLLDRMFECFAQHQPVFECLLQADPHPLKSEILRYIVDMYYRDQVVLGKESQVDFNSKALFQLVQEGIAGLKKEDKPQEYVFILKIILLEMKVHGQESRMTPIIKAYTEFYKNKHFYFKLIELFNYLEQHNKSAYLKCKKTPWGCLISLDRQDTPNEEMTRALVYFYRLYPETFHDLIDQILEVTCSEKNNGQMVLASLVSGLNLADTNQREVHDILNKKMDNLIQEGCVSSYKNTFFKLPSEVAMNLSRLKKNVPTHENILSLKLFLRGLNEQYPDDPAVLNAAIYSLCKLDKPLLEENINKIGHFLSTLIQPSFSRFFKNDWDDQMQILLDRILEGLYLWGMDVIKQISPLNSETQAFDQLFKKLYNKVEENIQNKNSPAWEGLKQSFWKIGIHLDRLNLLEAPEIQLG